MAVHAPTPIDPPAVPQPTAPNPPPATDAPHPVHPDTLATLADWGWLHDEYNKGRWVEYMGEYIAVADRQLLGHGSDPNELRARAGRESGYPLHRITVSYIESPDDL
jgi:hypothetical protein